MQSIPLVRQLILIGTGTIIIAILVFGPATLLEQDNLIGWLILDTAFTLLLIGSKGDKE